MTFDRLTVLAQHTVAAVQRRLPVEVREAAATVPLSYEPYPSDELVADGLEPDLLGLFVGQPHLGSLAEMASLPPQILLFLENIWDLADGNPHLYEDEVRLTYLHELGHFLGWDEDEIAHRGLE